VLRLPSAYLRNLGLPRAHNIDAIQSRKRQHDRFAIAPQQFVMRSHLLRSIARICDRPCQQTPLPCRSQL
jgi:hypothetical protein